MMFGNAPQACKSSKLQRSLWGNAREPYVLTPVRTVPQTRSRPMRPGVNWDLARSQKTGGLFGVRNAHPYGWFPTPRNRCSLHPTFGFSVRNYTLNVEVLGPSEGPALLLLHGWGRSRRDMRPLAEGLAPPFRAHLVDLPGHGASPDPPEPWGVPEHADVLNAYIHDSIPSTVTVVGHSNGGRVALYMAGDPASAPIERLALISPSGVAPERSWAQRLRAALATALKAPVQTLPAPVRAPAEDWLRHSLVWRLLGSADYNAEQGVMRDTFVRTVNHHLNGALRRVDVPTLLFWGTEDEAVSRRQMNVMASEIPDCGLVELEGAGHFGHLEQPDVVQAGLQHFLKNS